MPNIAVLQEKSLEQTSWVELSYVTFDSPVTLGSYLECVVSNDDNAPNITVFDSLNPWLWTQQLNPRDSHNAQYLTLLTCGPSYAGVCTVTVALAPWSKAGPTNIIIREIGNCVGLDKVSGNYPGHGSGSNAINSPAMTPSVQPGLITVTAVDDNRSPGTMTVGTNVAFSTGPASNSWSKSNSVLTESFRYTSTAAIQGAANDANGATDYYVVVAACYIEGTPVGPRDLNAGMVARVEKRFAG
jgi:hypothetical protein